jgi:hypothetical protein
MSYELPTPGTRVILEIKPVLKRYTDFHVWLTMAPQGRDQPPHQVC